MYKHARSYLIRNNQGKVRVVERFSHSYPLGWIEGQKLLNEVQEVPVNEIVRWYHILKERKVDRK
jgi:hypothetical protein